MDEDVQARNAASDSDSSRLRFFQEDIERGLKLIRSAETELQARNFSRARYLIGESRTVADTMDRFLTDLPSRYSKLRPALRKQTQTLRDAISVAVKRQKEVDIDFSDLSFTDFS